MLFQLRRAALRSLVGAAVCACVASSADASLMNGNFTAGFDINRGYSEVSTFNSPAVTLGALSMGNGAPVNMFFEVANSGGAVTHSFSVNVTNVSSAPITTFRFQVGTSNLNWYQNADTDGDGIVDLIDPDIDNDTVANNLDNARWTANTLQLDLDGDQWGDVADFAPTNASVPINQVGGQAQVPMTNPGILFNVNPNIDFLNTPTSNAFANFVFVPGELIWTNGSIAPGATATFTFDLNVRENMPNGGFVLSQIANVPEPTTALAAMIAMFGLKRRSRASLS